MQPGVILRSGRFLRLALLFEELITAYATLHSLDFFRNPDKSVKLLFFKGLRRDYEMVAYHGVVR